MVVPLAVLSQKRVAAGFVVCDQSLDHIFRMRTIGSPLSPQFGSPDRHSEDFIGCKRWRKT